MMAVIYFMVLSLLDDVQLNGDSLLPSEDAKGDVSPIEGMYFVT